MPEPVFYARGFQPTFATDADANPRMMADLKAVSTLSEDEVTSLCERLSQVKGFLDPKTLATEIRRVIKVEGTARSVLATLRSLEPEYTRRLVEGLTERGKHDTNFPLNEAELDRLGEILQKLIQPYPALVRFEKAERLATLTGQQLESIDLICDLRPIFDENRKQIEGMMPYTRLHIVATGADGFPKSFEAELTYRQVNDLKEKAEKANIKLDVLHKSVERWLPEGSPDLPLTRVTRKESSDA